MKNIRMGSKEWGDALWTRVKSWLSNLDTRVTTLEQGGGGGGAVSGVKGDAESSYRTGNVNLTAANLGAKATQSAVSDPTASGTGLTFIDSITQDAQGVITPTKKTVQTATQSADGVMSSTDKAKLDGIASGAQVNTITGVKGDAETDYRTGNVNLTPANLGALANDHIYNGLDTSMTGYALDARQGTALNTRLSAVESKLSVSSGVFGVSSYTSVHAVGANYLIKFNNIVFGMLNMTFGTASGNQIKIPLNTAFASVPVGFRPSSTITVPAMMQYNAGSWAAYEVTIGSDGNIKQSWSSSMTGIYLSVVYSIA